MTVLFNTDMLRMKNYWLKQLSHNIYKTSLPVPSSNKNASERIMETISISVDEEKMKQIQNLAGDSSFLQYVIFLSALNVCLFKYNGDKFVTIGGPAQEKEENNKHPESSVVISNRVSADMTGKELMTNIRQNLLDAYSNQSYPLNFLIRDLNLSLSHFSNPLFSIFVEFTNIHCTTLKEDSDIIIRLTSKEKRIFGEIEYNTKIFKKKHIILFKNHIDRVLEALLSHPNYMIDQYPTLNFPTSIGGEEEENQENEDLNTIKNILMQHPSIEDVLLNQQKDKKGQNVLIAYLMGRPGQIRSNQLIKMYLLKRVSENMIPSQFIWLDYTEGGIDKHLLPQSDTSIGVNNLIKEPGNKTERDILNIWKEILDIENIGVNDNFFEIGGDSLLSIQVYYKMKEIGLNISPKDLIASPTIAELALIVGKTPTIKAEQSSIKGTMPLTPSQLWFFEKRYHNVNHYNNSWIYKTNFHINPEVAKKTLNVLANHHDAIRLRFVNKNNGWEQHFTELEDLMPFEYYDFSNFSYEVQKSKIEELSNYYQTTLDITHGPLFRAVFFYLGKQTSGRLLIVTHRLLTDSTTITVLAEDFQTVYTQLIRGENPELPDKTTSYKTWAIELTKYAQSKEVQNELKYWTRNYPKKALNIPVDYPKGDNTEASTRMIFTKLNKEDTEYLIRRVPNIVQASVKDIAFTSLLKTICQWSGEKALIVESGGHGREIFTNNIDLSRTVGWFTTNFPVFLELEDNTDIKSTLLSVKKQMESIPQNGFGYGLLRYLNKNNNVQNLPFLDVTPAIGFDYQGKTDNIHKFKEEKMFLPTEETLGNFRDPNNERIQEFDISSWVSDSQYVLRWSYSEKRYKEETIKHLINSYINNLKDIIKMCKNEK